MSILNITLVSIAKLNHFDPCPIDKMKITLIWMVNALKNGGKIIYLLNYLRERTTRMRPVAQSII
jgi:hypothetical protein